MGEKWEYLFKITAHVKNQVFLLKIVVYIIEPGSNYSVTLFSFSAELLLQGRYSQFLA